MNIIELPWDSNFFNQKIGKLILNENDIVDFPKINKELFRDKYDLVYIISINRPLFYKFTQINLQLSDIQLIYEMEIDRCKFKNTSFTFKKYLTLDEKRDCYNITEEISIVSRFHNEFGDEKTKTLYREWVDNTLNGKFADGFIIIKHNKHIVGMNIIKNDFTNKTGYCSLIGIYSKYRGMGWGKLLWEQTLAYWSKNTNVEVCKVPISLQNINSINFHMKVGFNKIDQIKYIYHWKKIFNK